MTFTYYHEDISVLAKSLKKQLLALGSLPGHVELLNMLARACGSQNYQSWSASSDRQRAAPTEEKQANAEIEFRLLQDQPTLEVFAERRPDGSFIDRRHEPVSRVHLLIDVELRVGAFLGTLRAHASIASDLLPAAREKDPHDWFQLFVVPALVSLCMRNPRRMTIYDEVDLPLDNHVTEDDTQRFNDMRRAERVVLIPLIEANRLSAECKAAARSAEGFNRVKEVLWDLLGRDDIASVAQKHPTLLRAIGAYLKDYLSAEGDLFMGNWNEEKLSPLAAELVWLAKHPRSKRIADWDRFRRSIYAAYPPRHWTRPVFAPEEIFASV